MPLDQRIADAGRLFQQGNLPAAGALCRQALLASPDEVTALALLAKIGRQRGDLAVTERLLQEALSRSPGLGPAELWLQLGLTLRLQQRLRHSAEAYHQAVLSDPDFVAGWINLSAVSCELQQWPQAERCARRVLELDPVSVQGLINLGQALHSQGNFSGEISCLELAVRQAPTSALAQWNLSQALLLQGDFARGWDHYEWREQTGQVAIDAYPYPRWDGRSLAGSVMLVHGEQGVGDEVFFASCFDALLDHAAHCVLVCDPRLAPLFRRSFPEASVIGYMRRKDHLPVPLSRPVDWQAPAGSLPRFCRRALENFPRRRQFLYADPDLIDVWRNRLQALAGVVRVGISWRGGGQAVEHRRRSTHLSDWRLILSIPGVQWINLQYGDTSQERAWAQQDLGTTIHDWTDGDPLVDLDGFAARLSALDLVISVDNATVHLAGALGLRTWAMLPRIPNWRWGLAGEQTPWYASVRLIRQTEAGQWESVFSRVAQDLLSLLAERGVVPPQDWVDSRRLGMAGRRSSSLASSVSAEIGDMQGTLQQAIAHFAAGRFDEAEILCRAVLCLAPRQVRGLHLMAQLARRSGRTQLALDTLRRALSIQQRPELCHEYALVLADLNRDQESRAQLERALQLDPNFAPAQAALGRLRAAAAQPQVLPGPHWVCPSVATPIFTSPEERRT